MNAAASGLEYCWMSDIKDTSCTCLDNSVVIASGVSASSAVVRSKVLVATLGSEGNEMEGRFDKMDGSGNASKRVFDTDTRGCFQ